ncbi:MAG: hypothetical protein IPM79_36015 [Polyangiaceae bacterium]|nr:hypothetical protein [Polyangiaceae bacterium]
MPRSLASRWSALGASIGLLLGCSPASPGEGAAPASSPPATSATAAATTPAPSPSSTAPLAAPSPPRGAVEAVELGGANLCALEAGSVWCVGDWPVPFGQNGVRNQGLRKPMAVGGLADVKRMAVAQHRGCAIVGQGAVECWGNTTPTAFGWTGASEGRLDAVAVPGLTDVVSLALGASGSCALTSAGKVTCWGPVFRPAVAGTKTLPPMRTLAIDGVKQIDASGFGMCALRHDGTVHCTGLGAPSASAPLDEALGPVVGLAGATQIAVGGSSGCALHASGEVSCWGANGSGQLGDGTLDERKGAVRVRDLKDAVAIDSGHDFSCALTRDDRVVCWGHAGSCVLGDEHRACVKKKMGSTMGEVEIELCPLPQRITLPISPKKISVGSSTGCATDAAGKVACWGRSLTESPAGCTGSPL